MKKKPDSPKVSILAAKSEKLIENAKDLAAAATALKEKLQKQERGKQEVAKNRTEEKQRIKFAVSKPLDKPNVIPSPAASPTLSTRSSMTDLERLSIEVERCNKQATRMLKQQSISPSDRDALSRNAVSLAQKMVKQVNTSLPDNKKMEQTCNKLEEQAKVFKKSSSTKESKGILGTIRECLKSIGEFIIKKLSFIRSQQPLKQSFVAKHNVDKSRNNQQQK